MKRYRLCPDARMSPMQKDSNGKWCRWADVEKAYEILLAAPEINMNNYTEDQVTELNTAVIEACNLLGQKDEKKEKDSSNPQTDILPFSVPDPGS